MQEILSRDALPQSSASVKEERTVKRDASKSSSSLSLRVRSGRVNCKDSQERPLPSNLSLSCVLSHSLVISLFWESLSPCLFVAVSFHRKLHFLHLINDINGSLSSCCCSLRVTLPCLCGVTQFLSVSLSQLTPSLSCVCPESRSSLCPGLVKKSQSTTSQQSIYLSSLRGFCLLKEIEEKSENKVCSFFLPFHSVSLLVLSDNF